MHSPERRGAHQRAHPANGMAQWDSVRIFLEVARIGSFRAAAVELNASANYLRKRILQLEGEGKARLKTRGMTVAEDVDLAAFRKAGTP